MIKNIYLTLLMLVLFLACNNTNEVIEDVEKTSDSNFIFITPSTGVIGTKLKLYGQQFTDTSWHWDIKFNNVNHWFYVDSSNVDTVYTHIPFGAESGMVVLQKWCCSETEIDTFYFKNLNVLEKSPDSVVVRWSNLNYEISNSLAERKLEEDWEKWNATKMGDTIRIFASRPMGESHYDYELKLLDCGKNKLPKYIYGAEIQYTDYGTSETIPMEKSIIKIEQWDTEGIISGRVLSAGWTSKFIFWYKFN